MTDTNQNNSGTAKAIVATIIIMAFVIIEPVVRFNVLKQISLKLFI
ncbi:MAG: hypothetical protein ABIY50_07530 [Ignavibacteria bacterium]